MSVVQFRRLHSTVNSSLSSLLSKTSYQATTYSKPSDIVITRGKGSYLYDDINGREYIDFTSGIAVTSLGHANEGIQAVLNTQAGKLVHSSNLYHNIESLGLSEKLVEKTRLFKGQWDASKVFLCNSGTEANEAALKFAKKHGRLINPQKQGIIAFKNSFHGRTLGALSVTSNSKYRLPFGDLLPGVTFLDAQESVSTIEAAIEAKADSTAGLILEPIQGEGGIFPIPDDKIYAIKRVCKKHNIIVIFDEIQCGMGRTGKLWAHSYLPKEAHPDIFTVAKALGNGYPIGATIVNEEINSSLQVGDHGTTYGGNPLASAIGMYVLDKIANVAFLDEVIRKGRILEEGLKALRADYPIIKDVRGKGLILGMALGDDPTKLLKVARGTGLLLIAAGNNTVRMVPALTIEEEVIQTGLEKLEKALFETYYRTKNM